MGKAPEDKNIYTGEMFVSTIRTKSGLESQVYTKDTFIRDGCLHMDTEGATLALTYDIGKIEKFIKSGIISLDDGTELKDSLTSLEQKMKTWRLWKKNNPNAAEEEIKAFHQLTGIDSFDEEKRKTKDKLNVAIRRLIAQKNYIEEEMMESLPELFRTINSEDCFAITKPIMDRIYHLPDLLTNAVAKQISGSQWVIESKVNNKGTGPIGLSHNFTATSSGDAKLYLDEYRTWMRGEGLKTLTAYWKIACDRGRFQFFGPLTDVMVQTADNKRKSHFSVKERQKFWLSTRRLENTKLTLELHFPKAKRMIDKKLVIEHRLVDVGARVHDVDEDSYPTDLRVKVLSPSEFQEIAQIGTAIHNNTLNLRPKDVLLALSLQTRQAQTQGKKINTFDEDFLIERANLEKTAKSNKSAARKVLNKKLEKLEKDNIIGGSKSSGRRYQKHTIKDGFKKKSS
jgi:hypothetical protein